VRVSLPCAATRSLLLAAVLATATCKPHRPADSTPAPSGGEFVLRVINAYKLDVTVYLIHDGQRTRVGTVTAMATHDFVLAGWLLGVSHRISLVGDPFGSNEFVQSERVLVEPGQFVEWTLASILRNSYISVY
jgi:hypothetical protein